MVVNDQAPIPIQQEMPTTPDWKHSAHHAIFRLNSQNVSSGRTVFNTPPTSQASGSPRPQNMVASPRTPKDADKSTLARSILRSLGRSSQSAGSTSTPSRNQPESTPRVQTTSQGAENGLVAIEAAQDETVATPVLLQPPAASAEVIVISDDSATASRSASVLEAPPRQPGKDISMGVLRNRLFKLNSDSAAKASTSEAFVDARESFPDVEAPEEISTPGAIQMALEDAREASPPQGSNASPPPVSRMFSPIDNGIMDVDEVQPAGPVRRSPSLDERLLLSLQKAVHSPTRLQSPADAGAQSRHSSASVPISNHFENRSTPEHALEPSREPLFFSSPLTSIEEIDMPIPTSSRDRDEDAFVPSGLLGLASSSPKKNKGKGRARDSDSDGIEFMGIMMRRSSPPRARKRQKVMHVDNDGDIEIIESSEPEEARQESRNLRRRFKVKVEVVVPPLSQELLRIKRRSESFGVPAGPSGIRRSSVKRPRIVSPVASETDEVEDLVGRGSDDSTW